MSTTATLNKLLTLEDYSRLPDDGRNTELVRGRIVEVPPTYPYHGYVCGNVYRHVDQFVRENSLGRVMTNDSGVVTERDPDTLRGADVAYYSYARLPKGPLPHDSYLTVAPDLIFEVRSPSDRRSQVLLKVTEYLTAGVTAVCVLNPEAGTAMVYRDNLDPEPFASAADLTFPDVLPGFCVPLRQFFE
jgi:Uma2 family endonuclease